MKRGEIERELYELQQRIARLPLGDRLLVDSILAEVRKQHFTDHDAINQEIAAAEAWYVRTNHGR